MKVEVKVMLKIAKTEFYKLKRYSVVWIGVATMLTVVLLTRFMATASDGAVHTLEYFSNSVIWNNFSLIFPATITLIAGYIIERERVDDTLKNILTIPIPFRKLLAGKLIAVGGLAIILAAIEFVFTMIIFFISRFPGFSFAGMILALVRMIGMNLFVYVAVLPIIVFTGQRAGSFMAGVGFSFFYGFVGTFASMSVAAKTKQYGAMRAVGMDGRQLTKMITAEVLTYAAFGCVIGCAVGLYLNKTIYEAFITAYFGEIWHIPVREIAIILLFIFASVVMAVHAPAKRMRNMEITATINDM